MASNEAQKFPDAVSPLDLATITPEGSAALGEMKLQVMANSSFGVSRMTAT